VGESQQLTWSARLADVLRAAPPDYGRGIRPASKEDEIPLGELYFAAYAGREVARLEEAHEELRRTFAGEYGALDLAGSSVAASEQRLVGAVLTVHEAPWPDTPSGPFVIEVMVHPRWRRRHLALRCMLSTAAALRSRGEERMALRVKSDNEGALALYRRLGFRPVGEEG